MFNVGVRDTRSIVVSLSLVGSRKKKNHANMKEVENELPFRKQGNGSWQNKHFFSETDLS